MTDNSNTNNENDNVTGAMFDWINSLPHDEVTLPEPSTPSVEPLADVFAKLIEIDVYAQDKGFNSPDINLTAEDFIEYMTRMEMELQRLLVFFAGASIKHMLRHVRGEVHDRIECKAAGAKQELSGQIVGGAFQMYRHLSMYGERYYNQPDRWSAFAKSANAWMLYQLDAVERVITEQPNETVDTRKTQRMIKKIRTSIEQSGDTNLFGFV